MFNKTRPVETGPSSGMGIPTPPEPTPYRPSETARAAEPPRAPAAAPSGAGAGAAGAARSSNLSTLSAGVNYEGNISGSGELQVDGKLKGDIRVARVVIGENGSVEGNVAADVVEIRGRVSGTVAGKSVKLFASSRVEGDITQEQLSVEQGAWFQGRCIQAKREVPVTAATSPAQSAPDRYQPEKPVAPALPGGKVEAKPA